MKFRVFILCFCFVGSVLHASSNDLNTSKCDLLKQDCILNDVSISLKDKKVKAMHENILLLKGDILDPNIKIKGVQMDMGDMPISIKPIKSGEYEFKFIPSMCMKHHVMDYEIFLYSGSNLVGKIGDFSVGH